MKKYKAVIFDLDGTILDSMGVWDDVAEKFLIGQGIIPPANVNELLKTLSFEESAQYFIEQLGVKLTVSEIKSEINKMVENYYQFTIDPKPFVKEYIEKLHSEKIKMCIATTLDKNLAEKALARLGLLDYFQFILTCSDVQSGKDKPDIYIAASQKLGYSREDVLVFEDAVHAIKSAKSAGFDVVSVYDKSAEHELSKIKELSDYHIKSFKEMGCLF